MLGDRQGQQLVGKKEARVVCLKALFIRMVKAGQAQKSEQTEVRTCKCLLRWNRICRGCTKASEVT